MMFFTTLENNRLQRILQASVCASLFCFALVSCGGSKGEVVASVDDKELTADEAYTLMEYFGYDPKDNKQYKEFLEEWCENETFKAELKSVDEDTYHLVTLRSDYFSSKLAKYYLEEKMLKGAARHDC